MGRADSLSRRVDWAEGVEKDNENQVMLKEEWLEVRTMEQLVEGPEDMLYCLKLSFILQRLYLVFHVIKFTSILKNLILGNILVLL